MGLEYTIVLTDEEEDSVIASCQGAETQEEKDECIKDGKAQLSYAKIQPTCARSGSIIEHFDFKNSKPWKNIGCPSSKEYIEKYGFDPNKECYSCEKNEDGNIEINGKLLSVADADQLCNPCNPCLNISYDEDCIGKRTYYLIFDLKSGRYWEHPETGEIVWVCEESAVRAWESDTPPDSLGKQEISFYDKTRVKDTVCPVDRDKVTGDKEEDQKLKHIRNDFQWCVPMWNDQCRFAILEITHILDNNDRPYTVGVSYRVMPKCNQEECDLAEENGLNPLPRHAIACVARCYDIDKKYTEYPQWMGKLVNETETGW